MNTFKYKVIDIDLLACKTMICLCPKNGVSDEEREEINKVIKYSDGIALTDIATETNARARIRYNGTIDFVENTENYYTMDVMYFKYDDKGINMLDVVHESSHAVNGIFDKIAPNAEGIDEICSTQDELRAYLTENFVGEINEFIDECSINKYYSMNKITNAHTITPRI